MSDKFFVGLDLTSAEDNGVKRPISRVTLLLDDENSVTAGDDTGTELLADCPHATQAMADAILAQVKGYRYQMLSADDAALDPSAELGDGVTAGGLYSVISRLADDGSGFSGIAAPGESELEDEYPSCGPMTQTFDRKIAQTNSRITKTAEEIRLEVEDTKQDLSQTLRVAADGVTITNAKGDTLTIDGGQIDASKIKTEELDAGRINVNDLQLAGAISWGDLASDAKSQITSAQNTASSALSAASSAQSAVGEWKYQGTTYIDGSKLMTGTVKASSLQGGNVMLLNNLGNPVGIMHLTPAETADSAIELYSYSALRLTAYSGIVYLGGSDVAVGCANFYPRGTAANLGAPGLGMWSAVYSYTGEIITSDRTVKHGIEPIPGKYLDMLDKIEPVRFQLNNGESGRYHLGYIAQDVEAAMEACGVDPLEFAGWCKGLDAEGNELQMLRYTEFVPLYAAKLRRLEERVSALERRLS